MSVSQSALKQRVISAVHVLGEEGKISTEAHKEICRALFGDDHFENASNDIEYVCMCFSPETNCF